MRKSKLIERAKEAAVQGGPHAALLRELSDALAKMEAKEQIRLRDAAIQTGKHIVQLPRNAREAVIRAREKGAQNALRAAGVTDDHKVADIWRNDSSEFGRLGRLMIVRAIERTSPKLCLEPVRPEDAVGFNQSVENLTQLGWVRVEEETSDE